MNAKGKTKNGLSWVAYDLVIFVMADVLLFVLDRGTGGFTTIGVTVQVAVAFAMIFSSRYAGKLYSQSWLCGGIQCFVRLLFADAVAGLAYLILDRLMPISCISSGKLLAFCCMNTFGCLAIRMLCCSAYKCGVQDSRNRPEGKRQLCETAIEEILMRKPQEFIDNRTREYYRNKTILITGGGGSIGSELCRQLAKMKPKRLIVLDVYENCAYDLQQSILFHYKGSVDIKVEIASIRDKKMLGRCFAKYHPDICINAAAHKHVPLMEANCVEAVENNVFGCLNVMEACEEYGCDRFIMVSTDKAVNPTNVMGATKRVCEMIMQAYSTRGRVKCSATRFGNVIGSAGSVIPLFKRQIAAGGPVTVTDKRIIRYFMTIPEASQLVLTSGALAENGDLFVLNMGQPVKIWDVANKMVQLSGRDDIEVVETGLRPGEKLYEELVVKTEKTDNELFFIEHEAPISMEQLAEKMKILRTACDSGSDDEVREALKAAVPTYRRPEEVNGAAEDKLGLGQSDTAV